MYSLNIVGDLVLKFWRTIAENVVNKDRNLK